MFVGWGGVCFWIDLDSLEGSEGLGLGPGGLLATYGVTYRKSCVE